MPDRKSLFRQIMKGTAVFGGTQAFTMLINIVRGKLIAILLGAFGMGISSLLQSALAPLQQFFSFGLPTAAVREISKTDTLQRAMAIAVLRRMLALLAVAGALTMLVTAPWLSITTFGNEGHADWFRLMSVALFFFIMAAGESAVLQGMRQLQRLALAGVVAPVAGLVVGIPLYYRYGIYGIVPAMIVVSFLSWVVARVFTFRQRIQLPNLTWRETWRRGRSMLALGGVMMVAGIIGSMCTYLLNTYIRMSDIHDVGFFQAANSITLQCTSMIFAAMATDYFPQLSSVTDSQEDTNRLVEQEGEVVLLVITPVVLLLMLFAPLIVRVLLTSEFDCITPVLRMLALSFFGRAFCFPQDYVCMARGDKMFFFFVEGIYTNAKTIAVFCLGYYFWGFVGLGYAALVNCVLDIVSSALLNKLRYRVGYEATYYRLFAVCVGVALVSFLATTMENVLLERALMTLCAAFVCVFSYRELDKRMDLKEIIGGVVRRRRNKR